ncbi:MAG: 1-deoxy-D-xylulose-5-phosphate synthase [Weeksellaceae bacterium]|nr:1-deoxy-D-xylulose-5-phosphate synthase [Weeksellaceae bacterium]
MQSLLSTVHYPEDLRQLSQDQLPQLATELRESILDILASKPGHLGASLGVVELTIALHYHFHTPQDRLIWDVGHQAYAHKMLTGRLSDFDLLRQWQGLSGFPSRAESEYDVFGTGHSSTSISAITGMALASKLQNEQRKHIAVIGDASIVSGMAFEGLNHLGDTDLDVLIVLNDNNIAIDPAVGALKSHLNARQMKDVSEFFQSLGFHYSGVVDGHSIPQLLETFEELHQQSGPKILHVRTVKGKGYSQAEKNQVLWHAPGPFEKSSGQLLKKENKAPNFQKTVGDTLHEILTNNPKACVITPAMPTGSGLNALLQDFPQRAFDVGIAEQHAVTLAAGLAVGDMLPYCVIYSTFLQRAYDQVIHDVALQNLPVVFLIDRAGYVGEDGATHHGIFDALYFSAIPNIQLIAPLDCAELALAIHASQHTTSLIAIRYPKGYEKEDYNAGNHPAEMSSRKMKSGENLCIVSTGFVGQNVSIAVENSSVAWFHFPILKPLDERLIAEILIKYSTILVYEESVAPGVLAAGFQRIAAQSQYAGKLHSYLFPDHFVEQGTLDQLEAHVGFSVQEISARIAELSASDN